MIGIVVVSHSYQLGHAVADLAAEMVPAEARPKIAVASGLGPDTFGTDAAAIAQAIEEVDSPDGVLVLVDLGSAILSSQMALEFVDPDVAAHTVVSSAPLVEGLVAALVTASTGASLHDVAAEASQGLLGKQEQVGDDGAGHSMPDEAALVGGADSGPGSGDTSGALSFNWTIRNPHGLHARPAAELVAGLRGLDADIQLRNNTLSKGPASARSLTSIQTLGLRKDDELSARITGADAEFAKAKLAELAEADFGEHVGGAGQAVSSAGSGAGTVVGATTTAAKPVLDPSRNGRQIVIGPAHHVELYPDISNYVAADAKTEATRLTDAVAAVTEVLEHLELTGDAEIYQVQSLILHDEDMQSELQQGIASGMSAVKAVTERFGEAAAQLEELEDPYLRARAEDVRGVQRMLLRALLGEDVQPKPASGVLILPELDPIMAGSLDPELCEGIVTTAGGATGHGAIVAGARGFALLTGQAQAADIPEGTLIAIDPVEKQLWVDPAPDQLAKLEQLKASRNAETKAAATQSHEPALTKSGKRVLVEANVTSLADAEQGDSAGAEGSGLVRTEVLFGDWGQAPSAEEQAAEFVRIGKALDGHTITVRTWGPGGDKPLAFLPQSPEANPMLGERGIRAMKRLPELLDEQLRAVLMASREVPIRVMFPMISSSEEMAWGRERLAAVRASMATDSVEPLPEIPVGMMVETPAAALRAAEFVPLADFISIGTNDLTQYTMAVDRGNPVVASVAAGGNQAVWDLIAQATATFAQAGKPVAVCGAAASDPEAAQRLAELGVTELSVRPPLVAVIKQAVRSSS